MIHVASRLKVCINPYEPKADKVRYPKPTTAPPWKASERSVCGAQWKLPPRNYSTIHDGHPTRLTSDSFYTRVPSNTALFRWKCPNCPSRNSRDPIPLTRPMIRDPVCKYRIRTSRTVRVRWWSLFLPLLSSPFERTPCIRNHPAAHNTKLVN